MITEKNNVFYCDCGFSFARGRSGTHDCAAGLRKKVAESDEKCAALAAELSAISVRVNYPPNGKPEIVNARGHHRPLTLRERIAIRLLGGRTDIRP